MNRRQFLLASAAVAASGYGVASPPLANTGKPEANLILLRPAPGEAELMGAGRAKVPVWAYNGSVPGPVLRVRRGEELRVRLQNGLTEPTTVHWHGVRVPNAMDGVAGLTQTAVSSGGTFDYAFTPPDAGTFWYHPHHRTAEQMAHGLYGMLIVEETDAPPVDRDLPLVIADWRLGREGRLHEESLGSMGDGSHAGRLGNVLTVNGGAPGAATVRSGERVRLRLLNASNARVLVLDVRGLEARIVALDGQPVRPFTPGEGGIVLGPAQRADLVADVALAPGGAGDIVEVSGNLEFPVLRLTAHPTDVARSSPLNAPFALPGNGLPDPDLRAPLDVTLRIEGGAMGRLTAAVHNGISKDMRTLVNDGMVWAFNGVAGMADKPLFSVPRGRTVRVTMENETGWPHAMHVHGHHFRTLSGGLPNDDQAWRDTVLMGRGGKTTVAFVADNPGKWVLHCHMLEHQATGMVTWFEVT